MHADFLVPLAAMMAQDTFKLLIMDSITGGPAWPAAPAYPPLWREPVGETTAFAASAGHTAVPVRICTMLTPATSATPPPVPHNHQPTCVWTSAAVASWRSGSSAWGSSCSGCARRAKGGCFLGAVWGGPGGNDLAGDVCRRAAAAPVPSKNCQLILTHPAMALRLSLQIAEEFNVAVLITNQVRCRGRGGRDTGTA